MFATTIPLNGIAIIVWIVNIVIVGVTCYFWGRSDGIDHAVETIRRVLSKHGL